MCRLTEVEKTELTARFDKSDKKFALDNRKYRNFIEVLEQQVS
jgi:hypothetical protein